MPEKSQPVRPDPLHNRMEIAEPPGRKIAGLQPMQHLPLKRLFLAMFLLHCTVLTAIPADHSDNSALLGLTGDLLVNRDDPEEIFNEIQPALDDTDILFGNVEAGYSDNPRIALTAAIPSYAPLSNLAAFPAAGFDVVSMANNHVMDSGPESMLESERRGVERGYHHARRPQDGKSGSERRVLV